MLKEFKDFLLKGNLIELAVAFVMGVGSRKQRRFPATSATRGEAFTWI